MWCSHHLYYSSIDFPSQVRSGEERNRNYSTLANRVVFETTENDDFLEQVMSSLILPTETQPEQQRSTSAIVVAIVNTMSGERSSAQYILRGLREYLGPQNVHDIFSSDGGKFNFGLIVDFVKKSVPSILIVAGGDGTVSLAMDVCETTGLATMPYICVLPMGTGNDLSRTIGFGPGFSEPSCGCCCAAEPLGSSLAKMVAAPQSSIDRWTVRFFDGGYSTENCVAAVPPSDAARELVLKRPVSMINYFSIGFDAHIATSFAHFRDGNPKLCQSRVLNKVWYTFLGCGALCGEMVLDKVVIVIDGVVVPTPKDLKSIVVSNVTSFAAGVKLWKDSKNRFKKPCIHDGEVEVQGIFGASHMSMMQMGGLIHALKIGQGKHVVLRTPRAWCQFDGEPLDELATLAKEEVMTIEVAHRSVFPILSNA